MGTESGHSALMQNSVQPSFLADPQTTLALLIAGWGIGVLFLALYIWRDRQRHNLESQLHKAGIYRASVAAKLDELDETKDALAFEKHRATQLQHDEVKLTTQLAEREKSLVDLRARMENDFQAMASKTLDTAHNSFLERANETFDKYHQKANSEATLRHKAVDDLIKPMKDTLTRYEQGLKDMREAQKKDQGELSGRISDLAKSALDVKAEAAKLSTALKSGPRVRGRWGEEQLRNVVELTGMSQHCDFSEQQALTDQNNKLKKPDMVVRLPGARTIAVDSKVSLSAYMDAVESTDDTDRAVLFAKHADQIWAHVRSLGAKDYAAALRATDTLDFVVMFIPGENFFAAAMEAKPSLFQDAFEKNILLATPTTLIAILKSIAYGWRQEKATLNAHRVAGLAQDLYTSLRKMGDNFSKLGTQLERTVKQYNTTIGSIEGTVMPKARKFADYEMPGTEEALPELDHIEPDVRDVRTDRDLIITTTEPKKLAS